MENIKVHNDKGCIAGKAHGMSVKIFLTIAGLFALCMVGSSALANPWVPERRRPQFDNTPGYAVIPYAFDLPGIGTGYGVMGAANNVAGTHADAAGTFFGGDVNGQAAGIDSIHLIPKTLILDIGGAHLSRTTVQSYSQRGMNTDKNDYSEAEFGDSLFAGGRITATFFDRRVEAFAGYYGGRSRFLALRDRKGNLIVEAEGAPSEWSGTDVLGGRLDLSDDYVDPRRGIRCEPSLWWSPPQGNSADYVFTDFSLTAYVPIAKRSTWAFNYLRSDAYVLHKGETDPYRLAAQDGLDYDNPSDSRERQYIDSAVAENTYGSATSLGGVSRLRSYPEGRYRGAHTEFLGTELRWNVTDEVKPFDIVIMRDIRTAIQVAAFYEIGTVTDDSSKLWSTTRSSYGFGLRIVTASGLVYRMDLAAGKEGIQPCIFFQYPWEL
jgi:hypothetical protein